MTIAPQATTYTSITSKLVVFIFFVFLLFPQKIYAKVVINELLPNLPSDQSEDEFEWIELYNDSDQVVDVNRYVLKDEKGAELVITVDHTATNNTSISSKGLLVVFRKGAKLSLNNNQDTVFLFESTQSAEPVDQVSYTSTKENKSWGRIPDGNGSLTAHLSPTLGEPNQPPPTTTPKPTSTLKPKVTDKPSTPKPVPSTNKTTSSETKAQKSYLVVENESTVQTLQEEEEIATDSTKATVLGISQLVPPTTSPQPDNLATEDLEHSVTESSRPWMFFVSAGFMFAAAAMKIRKMSFSV